MRFCLLGVVYAHTSYRSTLLLLAAYAGAATPCVETVRGWLLRLGLYLLQHLPHPRADWVWIIDHTLQWGTARCLVILGVSQAHLQAHGFRLSHADVCVLALEVIDHSDGDVVHQQLTALAERVGVPRQIVSDHGADLAKGIRWFQGEQPEVLDTYDVTHKMACFLKGWLAPDARWQAFVRQCGATGARVRQTAGSFLLPPTLRTKARYMNLETLLQWATRMQGLLTPAGTARLATALDLPVAEARHWWQETFGWLEEYRSDLQTWTQYWDLVCRAEAQVREEGMRRDAGQRYRATLPPLQGSDDRVPRLAEQIESFLAEEGGKVPCGEAWLGSSEIIESVFGRYKQYVERGVWSEIGSNVLLLPVLLVTLSTSLLWRALQAVGGREVLVWCRAQLGKSRQQRFRQVFGKTKAESTGTAASATGSPSGEPQATGRPPPGASRAEGAPGEVEAACRPPPSGRVAA